MRQRHDLNVEVVVVVVKATEIATWSESGGGGEGHETATWSESGGGGGGEGHETATWSESGGGGSGGVDKDLLLKTFVVKGTVTKLR